MISAAVAWIQRWAIAILLAAVGASLALAGWQTVSLANERTDHQATKAAHAQLEQRREAAAADATRQALRETARRMDRQQEADDAQAARQTVFAADAARARDAVQRLQHRIAALSGAGSGARGLDSTPAEQRAAIEAFGVALGNCSARHRQLADEYATDWNAGRACEARYDALTQEPRKAP